MMISEALMIVMVIKLSLREVKEAKEDSRVNRKEDLMDSISTIFLVISLTFLVKWVEKNKVKKEALQFKDPMCDII